jgi:hypothetical protein
MISKRFLLGLFVLSLAFAMTAVGCDDEPESKPETDPALNGTWVDNSVTICFRDGYIEYKGIGNYTTTRDGTITITYTNYSFYFLQNYLYNNYNWWWSVQEWYSRNDLRNIPEKTLNELFLPHTYTYFITDSAEDEILTIGEDSYKRKYF